MNNFVLNPIRSRHIIVIVKHAEKQKKYKFKFETYL